MPESDSTRTNSEQWDLRLPSIFNPTNPSSENSGSTSLSVSTLSNPSGTQLVNGGNDLLAHASISPGTMSADTLHLDGDPINTPVDFSGNIPFSIASLGTGGGSKSPPNYSFSEIPDTESPHGSPIPPFSQVTPPILAQNKQATSIESGDRANEDSNILTSNRQSADQALINGDSPLPSIPFSDILYNIFKAPSFDTPGDLREIDKVPGQQPLYDPEERIANPKRPDCEDGTYAMCCSLGPRLTRTKPVAQQFFGFGCKSPIYNQDPYYDNHEPPPPKDFGKLRVERRNVNVREVGGGNAPSPKEQSPAEQPKRPKPLSGAGSGTPSPGRPKKAYKCTKEQSEYYKNGGTGIFPPVSN
ncbi:hypothetical protein MMC31_000955 [Peltigera leucophlebia]|nr:hypothetical protein [Peltigera leucophlebia]